MSLGAACYGLLVTCGDGRATLPVTYVQNTSVGGDYTIFSFGMQYFFSTDLIFFIFWGIS